MTERTVYYDNGNVRMVWEFYAGCVYLHLKVSKWAPSVYRLMRNKWPEIKSILRTIGYRRIHAFYKDSNSTMDNFARRFGFRETKRGGGIVYMEADNA